MAILYGVSVGPGDPELITVKGLRILQNCPVVAFPQGVGNKPGLAETIISQWLLPQQHKLPLHFPYVQEQESLLSAWLEAAQKVWQYLKQNLDVAFVCLGDVSFYSTFTYLAQTLQQLDPQIIIKTVPGISSPVAAASALGIPLTIRHQRLVVLPALYSVEDLTEVLAWADVVVLLKVSSVYQLVWQILEQHQLLEKAKIVEWATMPNQTIYQDLRSWPELKLSYFSLLLLETR